MRGRGEASPQTHQTSQTVAELQPYRHWIMATFTYCRFVLTVQDSNESQCGMDKFMDERALHSPLQEERVETYDNGNETMGGGSHDKTTTSLVNGLVVMATEIEL